MQQLLQLFPHLHNCDSLVLDVALGHNDFMKWKHFSHYWTFVRGIHRSPVDSLHKSQSFDVSLIWAWETTEKAIDIPVIWDAIALIMTSQYCNRAFIASCYYVIILYINQHWDHSWFITSWRWNTFNWIYLTHSCGYLGIAVEGWIKIPKSP